MKLRRLNEAGIEQFDRFRASPSADPEQLQDILENRSFCDVVDADAGVQPLQFPNRFAAGQYLNALFEQRPVRGVNTDPGLWAWLSAFYFDNLCPPGSSPGERARWVPAVGDFRKYYRHLLAGPYQIYRAHRDDPYRAMAVLANPVNQPGDIAEQLASRQELVTNKTVMKVATTLYINPRTNRPEPGAAARDNGSARRLADVLNQLDLTWDLYALEVEQLLNLLPDEFGRFIP